MFLKFFTTEDAENTEVSSSRSSSYAKWRFCDSKTERVRGIQWIIAAKPLTSRKKGIFSLTCRFTLW